MQPYTSCDEDFDSEINTGVEWTLDYAQAQRAMVKEKEAMDQDEASSHHSHSTKSSKPYGRASQHGVANKLTTATFAVMVFYSVSGGPFGCESSVRSAGNFFTLLGFLVFPFIWSIPEAMMVSELGSTFPEASGGLAWVEEAFGSRAGWMTGYLSWIGGATDNAIYPVLFLDYLLQVIRTEEEDLNPYIRFVCLSGTAVALAYVNWRGLTVVGNMSLVICFIAMSPFLILIIFGSFKVDPRRWFTMPSQDYEAVEESADLEDAGLIPNELFSVYLRPWLNNLFWNLNSFDAAASFLEDIDDPGRTLPAGMTWAVVLVALSAFFPLLVALGASDAPQEAWVDGYLAKAASDIVGPWLGTWTVFAAGISNIALFQAELSADAFQLMGMADRGHVPEIFGRRSRHGTPTYGILLGTCIIVLMSVSDLDRLVEMLNFNYAISLIMEYLAFFKLRLERPDLHRPFRVPLSTGACAIAMIPTIMFTSLILLLADWETYLYSIGVNVIGLCLYGFMHNKYFGRAFFVDFWLRCVLRKTDVVTLDRVVDDVPAQGDFVRI